MTLSGGRASLALVAALSLGCAPVREVRSERVLARRVVPAGEAQPSREQIDARLQGRWGTALVWVTREALCSVPIAEERIVEVTRARAASELGLAVEGGLATLATLGGVYAYASGADLNNGQWALLGVVAGGLIVATVVDWTASEQRREQRVSRGPVQGETTVPCARGPAAGALVQLRPDGGETVGARTDDRGQARIPIDGALWRRHQGSIPVEILVNGSLVRRATLVDTGASP